MVRIPGRGLADSLSVVVASSTDKANDIRLLRRDFVDIAYIGDTDSDILAARSVGVTAIGYSGV